MLDSLPTVPLTLARPVLRPVWPALFCLLLVLAGCAQQPVNTAGPAAPAPTPAVAGSSAPAAQSSPAALGPRSVQLKFELDPNLAKAFSIKTGTLSQCASNLTDIKTTLTLPNVISPDAQLTYQSQGMTVDTVNGKTVLTFANSLSVSPTQLTTSYNFVGLPTGTLIGKTTFKNANTLELGYVSFTATVSASGTTNLLIYLRSNNTESALPACPELAALISGGTMTATGGDVVAYVPTAATPTPLATATPTPTSSGTPLPSLPPGPTPAPLPTPPAAAALPQISAMSATSGYPLDTVVLTGTGFTNARTVKFDTVPAYSFTVDSDTQISAKVPVGFTSGLIVVGNSRGSVDSPDTFTLLPISRPARTTYVVSGGTGDGSSWANAAGDLAEALYLAVEGDQIWVAAGTYKPTTSGDRTLSFQLRKDVAVYGGFAGGETQLSDRAPDTNLTILSGDLSGNDDYLDTVTTDLDENSLHVVKCSSGVTGAVLDGFTIQGGNANSYSPHDRGGGMLLEPSAVTLNQLRIVENHALNSGGGMYHGVGSSAQMTFVSFNSNIALQAGGGMFIAQGSLPSFANVTFAFNEARSGGGIYNEGVSPTMTSMRFLSNKATFFGGGMFNRKQAGPIMIQASFETNHATLGGGIYNIDGASPDISLAEFKENSADNGGGIYNYNEAAPILNNVKFLGNTAVYVGGGMYNYKYVGLAPSVTNAVFAGNKAANGAGMANRSGAAPKLTNVVFSNNVATAAGGGIYNYNRGNPKLRHVTLANNSGPSGAEIYAGGLSNPVLTSSIVWNDTAASGLLIQSESTLGAQNSTLKNLSGITVTGYGNIEFDPIFVNPTNPAGPDGVYMTADDGLRLSHSSLSLNYGISVGMPTTDILGNTRMDPPDEGAYEGDFDKVTAPLLSTDLVVGTGQVANVGDKITVNYVGSLSDGTVFDSSYITGTTLTFQIGAGQVIPGWDQGIAGMAVGGKRKLVVPPELAYGTTGVGPIPPNATLTFEIELMAIIPVP